MKPFLAALALAAFGPVALAQSPVFQPFGAGCSFQGQLLQIGNQGDPRLGNANFHVTYIGPNYTFTSVQQIAWPLLVLGFGQAITPLPPGMLPQQPPGCTGYITLDFVIPTLPDPNGRAAFENFVRLPVPNDVGLLGFMFFAQWVLRFDQCGFAGCNIEALPTSDAAIVVIGM